MYKWNKLQVGHRRRAFEVISYHVKALLCGDKIKSGMPFWHTPSSLLTPLPQKATFLLLEEPGILITIGSIINYWFGSSFAALKNNMHNSSIKLLSFPEQKTGR